MNILRRPFSRWCSVSGIVLSFGLIACNPTVKVEAPEKPIEINLNIKIQQEVRVRVERDLEKTFSEDPALFGVPSVKGTKK